MGKEICFFIQTPLTARDYKRFGVEILQSRGFKVTFLDITSLINKEYTLNYKPELLDYQNTIIAQNKWDISAYLKNNRNVFVVMFNGADWNSLFVYQALRKYNIKFALMHANAYPSSDTVEHGDGFARHFNFKSIARKLVKANKINRQVVRHQWLRLKSYLFEKLPDWILRIKAPDYILAGGDKSLFGLPKRWEKAEIIWAHTFDYDLYLEFISKHKTPIIKTNYAVFLDEYLPFHPDCFVAGGPPIPYTNPGIYYNYLNEVFSVLEKKAGVPIVIAAHPRAQYELKPDYFNGRTIIKGATVDLVAHAKYVLAHGSTSANYAVLFKKPIIFLMPPKIENDWFYCPHYLDFSREFNKELLGIDAISTMDISKELSVENNAYSLFVDKYIKTKSSPRKYFWEIVADFVELV